MAKHLDLGKKGEEAGVKFLLSKNFTILHTNWRYKHLEIDIIAFKDNIIHFIEVKTRTEGSLILAKESLSYKKQQNLEAAATAWLEKNPTYVGGAQLDFIAITYTAKEIYSLEYLPNYSQ